VNVIGANNISSYFIMQENCINSEICNSCVAIYNSNMELLLEF